jgi:hypothetical protein
MIWLLNWFEADTILLVNSLIIILGILAFLIASLVKHFPVINIYRIPIQIAAVVLMVFGVYSRGALSIELEWKKRVADLEQQVAAAEKRSAVINTKIVTKVVTQVRKQTEYRDRVRTEIQVQKEYIDKDCKLNPTAIEMYNRAISGEQK